MDRLNLPKVEENLRKYFRRMPTDVRVRVSASWKALLERLESLPDKIGSLPSMMLTDLPKCNDHPVDLAIPEEFNFVNDETDARPEIVGHVYAEKLFDSHISKGQDVAIRTDEIFKRPWVGRILEVKSDRTFLIQWYERNGRSLKFRALMNDDQVTPYTSILENDHVMMWDISATKGDNSFFLTPHMLKKIMAEYSSYDG